MTGVYAIPSEQYHSDDLQAIHPEADRPSLSSSICKTLLAQSPAHARAAHPKLNPDLIRTDDAKYDIGTTVHALLLEGLNVADILHYDNWRTKEAKEARDLARAHGRVPLLAAQWDNVRRMIEAADRQLDALDITPRPFTNGAPEQTLVWEMDGVLCRALVDWLHNDHATLDDFKSTSASAHPDAWTKTMMGMGCDIQIAFHSAGVEAMFGVTPEWRYIVQETYPPYALSVISPAPAMIALGRDKMAAAVKLWRSCLAADSWPGYPSKVAFIDPPGWSESQWMEREAALVGLVA